MPQASILIGIILVSVVGWQMLRINSLTERTEELAADKQALVVSNEAMAAAANQYLLELNVAEKLLKARTKERNEAERQLEAAKERLSAIPKSECFDRVPLPDDAINLVREAADRTGAYSQGSGLTEASAGTN